MRIDTISGNDKIILTYTKEEKDKYNKLISKGKISDTPDTDANDDKSNAKAIQSVSGVIMMDYLPSTNRLFGTYRKKKYLYPELRDWRDYIVKRQLPISSIGTMPDTEYLNLVMILGITSGYGTRDLDNFLKFLIDTICEYYMIDDYRFSKILTYKTKILDSTTRWNTKQGDEYCFYRITPGEQINYSLSTSADKIVVDNLVNLSSD